MKNIFYFLTLSLLLTSCFKGENADLVIYNARIHTLDKEGEVHNAIAIKDGKILETGPEREIRNKYSASEEINAEQKEIYPGFHDAHGHISILALNNLKCDLRGSTSYAQMITRIEKHLNKKEQLVVVAHGWDQNVWGETQLPNFEQLNKAFPNQPVVCTRVDEHAMLINQAAVEYFQLNVDTLIEGGELLKENGVFTGILMDNAMSLINDRLPQPSDQEIKESIKDIQRQLLGYGITNVHEAGLYMEEFRILDEMATSGELKIGVYGMLLPTQEAFDFVLKNGHYTNGPLKVRSFKIIGDGALGSRGACLIHPYHDHAGNGFLTTSMKDVASIALFAKENNYQVNTHCIGDSTNRNLLHLIDTLMSDVEDHRWRIEHAQIVHPNDLKLFQHAGVIPSVQPTHAVSDMPWAANRLGEERLKNSGYLYKSLMLQNNIIAFGTDFPVEHMNPFLTLHAAINRQNAENMPEGGFQKEEAIGFHESLKAMTIWPAIASFQEGKVGTLEKNKQATFVILDHPLSTSGDYQPNYAWMTFIDGKAVFSMGL
ncbi:hypothetical protein SAMN05216474_2842 [Lishizhenia tianjinensis]|uniref:Amidohydrolase 3 domain-containing protein n=1 Tax=Lishizhenia tianjinensis TaxID=477690 RepID=A0A1I7BKI9_9FLAO|nr:amidohydrolase [Lishizhenia tianjinensis]SFT87686.1 hypothetical protein SAMN05216474_2842 [Lishizhenia tianjinensis]